jgi:uncharacterized membrane protein
MESQEDSRTVLTEERLERAIANLLRGGVLASATLVAVSGLIYLVQNHATHVDYAIFQMERSNLRTLPGIFSSAMRLRTDAMMQLGLVFLIATPVARVALAVLGFYLQGDRLMWWSASSFSRFSSSVSCMRFNQKIQHSLYSFRTLSFGSVGDRNYHN